MLRSHRELIVDYIRAKKAFSSGIIEGFKPTNEDGRHARRRRGTIDAASRKAPKGHCCIPGVYDWQDPVMVEPFSL